MGNKTKWRSSIRKWKWPANFSAGQAIANGMGHLATVKRYNQQSPTDVGQWRWYNVKFHCSKGKIPNDGYHFNFQGINLLDTLLEQHIHYTLIEQSLWVMGQL